MTKKSNELLIGAHTSIAGGVHNALLEGKEIGATTVQIFTANQRRWEVKALTPEAIDLWNKTLQETGLRKIMSHASYLINLGAPDAANLQKSHIAFQEEVERCIQLNIAYLNFHPGAAISDSSERCMERICESVMRVADQVNDSQLTLLIECTAGQGSVVGYNFEQLAFMLHKLEKKVRIGICIDTCHLFVAGYDLRTSAACDQMLQTFDQMIGLKHLHAFHLNDSVKGLGSKIDRHAALGNGEIGMECFQFLMTDPRTRHLPKYLETPDGPPLWIKEIALLREFAKEACNNKLHDSTVSKPRG